MRFRAVNGNIEIAAPSPFNANVELTTVNGSIESKYPLDFDRRHRRATGVVGKGGPRLTATAVNGSITLH